MKRLRRISTSVAVVGLLVLPLALHAAEAAQKTTIMVRSMCEGCAKKITKRMNEMPEVVTVETDVKSRVVSVVAKPGRQLSPKALWEAIEKSGEQPVELVGPAGTFTKKPTK